MRTVFLAIQTLGLLLLAGSAWAQTGGANACDLTNDGTVNAADVSLAVNMALGLSPCTANIQSAGACNVVVVQRVINAALGGTCAGGATGNPHSVSLTWVASISIYVVGYNVYRAPTFGGPYTKLNLAPVGGTTYTDSSVKSGQSYYYVATAVGIGGNESAFSNPPAQVIVQ